MELVTHVQNNLCESVLHTSTLRLQADRQHKMKLYAAEKRDLLRHLDKLTHDIKLLRVPDNQRLEAPENPDLEVPDKLHRVRNKQGIPRSTREQKPSCNSFPEISDKIQFRFRSEQGSARRSREQKPSCNSFPEISDKIQFRFRSDQCSARRSREQKPSCDSFLEDSHTLPPISDRFPTRPQHPQRDKDRDAEEHLQMFDQEEEFKLDENLDVRFSSLALCSDQSEPGQRLSDPRLSNTRLSDQRLSDTRLSDTRISDPRLSDTRLSDTRLSDPRLSDTRISDPKLSDTRISDPKLSDTRISDPRLSKKNKATQECLACRLPQLTQIREEHPPPHWYSGRNSQTFDQKAQESPTVLENLKEVRDTAETRYSLPAARDPVRSDIQSKPDIWIPSEPDIWSHSILDNGIPSQSAVSVPSKPDISVPSKSDVCVESKPQARKVRFSDNVSSVNYSVPHISRKCKDAASKKKCTRLAQVVRSRLNAGRDDWRSVYLDIQDQEERTRTLSEVLHTVRARMRHNELQLMNSQRPSEDGREDGREDQQDKMKRPLNKQRRNLILKQPFNRLHRRSNATRLQNYLTKLSRERRMSEWMECDGYRLPHTSSPTQQQSST